MPTFVRDVVANRVLIQVQASLLEDSQPHRFMALVDTWATVTCATRKVVEQVGAIPVGRDTYLPANGQPTLTNLYALTLAVPVDTPTGNGFATFAEGMPLIAWELPYQPTDYDVILGMDMLNRYHITLFPGKFIMST